MTTRPALPRRHRRIALAALAAVGVLTAAGCSAVGSASPNRSALDVSHWSSVLAAARGQTVNFDMYGGDTTLNGFITGYVADRLHKLGIGLNEVKVADTSDAINTVLGQRQAGKTSGGAVDAIWVNGENFATGMQAHLWSCGWPRQLPNARYVDFANAAVANDFGTPVRGCEAVWQQADSALVYNSTKLSASDVASVSALFAWLHRHPGQFTYPAPPDFTGSMAVRTILYDTIGGPKPLAGAFNPARYAPAAAKLWPRLRAIAPDLWRHGDTYPQTQDQVQQLYSNGEISAFFTYGPGAVADQVRKGVYPASTREAVPSVGNIANYSFVGIPADAAHRAAALVLANVLEDPATQLALYKAEGIYPGLDLAKTSAATRRQFAATATSPSVVPLDALTRHAQPELAAGYVSHLDAGWKTEILQR